MTKPVIRNSVSRHLQRLQRGAYQGQAHVHWTMTIANRATGWLTSEFHGQFREILTHTLFRYAISCPLYCLMPDHMHLLWIGIDDKTDQGNASRYLRSRLKQPLESLGYAFQHQAYDHVLRDDERRESSFISLADYIARNPERKGLVPADGYQTYAFTNCLVPGYPELNPWKPDYWPRFWRTYNFSSKNGLFRAFDEDVS